MPATLLALARVRRNSGRLFGRPHNEQLHRRRAAYLRQFVVTAVAVVYPQGLQGKLELASHAHSPAAGDYDAKPGQRSTRAHYLCAGLEDAFEVVEEEDELSACEAGGDDVEDVVAFGLNAEGARDGRDDLVRVRKLAGFDHRRLVSAEPARSATTSRASRDLPTPPGPVIVMKRAPPSRMARVSAATSRWRPTKPERRFGSGGGRSRSAERRGALFRAAARDSSMLASWRAGMAR